MIRQILKMLWNQRRSYWGIFVEQLLVAIILMLSVVSVTDAVKKYNTPGLLDVNNTVMIGYMFRPDKGNPDPQIMGNVRQNMDVIIRNLRQLPFVESVTSSMNLLPYMRPNDSYGDMISDSVTIDDKRFKTIIKFSDEFGASVLKVQMEEGVWLENHALPDGSIPTVITRQFADKAGWINAIGKKLTVRSKDHTIVGITMGLKQQSFDPSPVAMVIPEYVLRESNMGFSENAARIKIGSDKDFYEAFNKEFKRLISDPDVELLMYDMPVLKKTFMSETTIYITLQAIPTVFLFIFAFIGTFGLYWMVSRKRIKEFAVRIAMGSTPKQLITIVVGESLLITFVAILPALLLSFFIYEYTIVHVIGVSVTLLTMLLFSLVSAWYPAWKVSRVNPAEALQYE